MNFKVMALVTIGLIIVLYLLFTYNPSIIILAFFAALLVGWITFVLWKASQ